MSELKEQLALAESDCDKANDKIASAFSETQELKLKVEDLQDEIRKTKQAADDADHYEPVKGKKVNVAELQVGLIGSNFFYIGIADGMSIARVWARRYSK